MSWSEGGRLPSARKISQSIMAVLLLDTGANNGSGTSLIKNSTSSQGLKSPGDKVVLSCVRFPTTMLTMQRHCHRYPEKCSIRFNYNETCG